MNDEHKSSKLNPTKREVLRQNGALNTAKNFLLTLSLGFIATGASDLFLIKQNNPMPINIFIIVVGFLIFAMSYVINYKLEVNDDE